MIQRARVMLGIWAVRWSLYSGWPRRWALAYAGQSLIVLLLAAVWAGLPAAASVAQEPSAPREEGAAKLQARFAEKMNGVKLIGKFTILGKDMDQLPAEEYTIKSVAKLPQGDFWMFTTRIKYGDKDVTLPLPLEVKWAGDTPVITLTDLTLPGLGTFSSRVVLYNNKYAGTWTHGDVGGHLFGVIEKLPPAEGQPRDEALKK